MGHTVEPHETTVLLNHKGHLCELHRRIAIVIDPPEATLEDGSAVVTTCGLRGQVVGGRCDLVGNVVNPQLGVHEKRDPYLRI